MGYWDIGGVVKEGGEIGWGVDYILKGGGGGVCWY